MKKLLLASIIMFGICSFASAQTTESMAAKKAAAKKNTNAPAVTNAASVTPQKAAMAPVSATVSSNEIDGTVSEVKVAAPTEKIDVEKAKRLEQSKETEKIPVKKSKSN